MTGKEQQYSKMHYQFLIFSFLSFPFCSQLWILMNTLKFQKTQSVGWLVLPVSIFTLLSTLERFSLDCRKTKTKVNTLANQRA